MRNYLFSVCAIAWTIVITILSFMSMKDAPNLGFSFVDKIAHALIYFIFTIVWFLAFSKGITTTILKKNAIMISVIFSFIYGVSVEVMQETLVKHRQGDWKDVIANTIGTILAIIILKWLIAKNRKLKTQN